MGSTGRRVPDDRSLLDRAGGIETLQSAIDDFYRAVLAEPVLMGYFGQADLNGIKRHQLALFTWLLGGPDRYTGTALSHTHQRLRIPAEHYQIMTGHLVAALMGKGIPDDVFAAIGQLAGAVEAEIVYQPSRHPGS